MDRFDPFVKYADVYGDIINWEKDPMNKPQNQNKYFFSDGKTYYEQICKMLRLMSVFKEAFNQIYSNEDEISEAWENFVNNLSASVVEGSEPDVTLTWTDDSVNFEFTMVPGVQGDPGVGITSISFNSDYTMTITLSDGNTYTSMSLKGETGPQGPQGETGSGLQILDVYATLADLQSAHPTGQPGDAYQVGSGGSYTLYIWSSSQSAWIPAGSLGTVSPSLSNPLMNGTASAGSQNLYSRGDHVHPTDTSRASKEELDALIKTSQALIDQSFTYRESPAIQDGLTRIDKIKGNTLVWNQQLQREYNMTSSKGAEGYFRYNRCTPSYDSSTGVYTLTALENTGVSGFYFNKPNNGANLVENHKYLAVCTVQAPKAFRFVIGDGNSPSLISVPANTAQTVYTIFTVNSSTREVIYNFHATGSTNNWDGTESVTITDIMLFDLTQLGLDVTYQQFVSLFSLPYYSYNQGSLLSFNGNGIKTTGKNLLPLPIAETKNGITLTHNDDGSITLKGTATAPTYFDFSTNFDSSKYAGCLFTCLKASQAVVSGVLCRISQSNRVAIQDLYINNETEVQDNGEGLYFAIRVADGTVMPSDGYTLYPMLRMPNHDSTFEPYTSSTLSLSVLTYFPNGMNNVDTVYDELTSTKAMRRFGRVTTDDFVEAVSEGVSSGGLHWVECNNSSIKVNGYAKCNLLPVDNANAWLSTTPVVQIGTSNNRTRVYGTFTTLAEFKSQYPNLEICYELTTPVETAVDIDLSFKSYLNGTEQLLPVNGSVPSTSPIIADMTYLSIDDAMEYIIDKLANVPQNTQQILESLEDDVADLQTDVGALQPAVSALQTSVGNINTNIGQLSSTVAGNTSSISDMQSDISDLNTGLNNLEDTVTDNTSRIGTLESGLSATNGNVQNLSTSVSDLDDTVTAQGTTVTALDSIIQDISNNPVISSLGSHELGFVAAYVSATLPANTGTRVTIPKPTIFPNNYTPLFIVGMSTGSYNVSICEIPPTFGSSNSVNCRVWNHGSEQTTQITVYILCMRQRQSQ